MKWQPYLIAAVVTCGVHPHNGWSPAAVQLAPPIFAASVEPIDMPCPHPVVRYVGGRELGTFCPDGVLSVVDLRDTWTPALFAPGPDGRAPDFRAAYLQLAAERDEDGALLPANEGLAELYGVVPSLAIVKARLADTKRHSCHATIDSTPIAAIDRPFGQDGGAIVAANDNERTYLAALLERERARRKLASIEALATDKVQAYNVTRWKKLDLQHRGIVAAQQHLVCEGLMRERDADGSMTWRTGVALEMFQRRNFLLPNNRLDDETRAALATDSRELDFRFALRILRERVVDATGLIEDGTAGAGPQPILGRMLDPKAMRQARGHEAALPNGAPDLIAAATEAAAKQVGWTDAEHVIAFFERHPRGIEAAFELPPPPAYHASHMQLSAVIDRGDVFYDPFPIGRVVEHRPNLVLYADDHGTKRALVRWPTTIGGWADVLLPGGGVVQKWKESDVGPRVWRDLFAAPTWLPPKATPDRDLVKTDWNGHWDLKKSILGPGPRAAFGMVLLPHYQVFTLPNGTKRFDDHGIGTHGSASVTSIVNGTSHGCHRLYNQLAVRLADFLLRHRDHVVKGQVPEYYRRMVLYRGAHLAKVDTRGYLYELTPPISVDVTKGTIRTARKTPPLSSAPARP